MIDLKYAVQAKGFDVIHIKTDSIKIPDATPEIIQFVNDFGRSYGYDFEHETTYDVMCLVNDAVYIAREGAGPDKKFTAVGAQFQHPYVFKTLFSGEDITFDDLCETKQVMSPAALYLDMNRVAHSPTLDDIERMYFVGRIGRFVPVKGEIGGSLYRVKEGKAYAATGTKGFYWLDAELAQNMMRNDENVEIDMSYFEKLANDAFEAIDHYGEFQRLANG